MTICKIAIGTSASAGTERNDQKSQHGDAGKRSEQRPRANLASPSDRQHDR